MFCLSICLRYLHAFEDFYRKLGSTMGTISRPGRSRHSSGRSLLSFRDKDSPKSPRSTDKKVKEDKKVEEERDKEVKVIGCMHMMEEPVIVVRRLNLCLYLNS